jgi:hypothetical protein
MTESLAVTWAERAQYFLDRGLAKAAKEGRTIQFGEFSFIDVNEAEKPRVSAAKLIVLYESSRDVQPRHAASLQERRPSARKALLIVLPESIDELTAKKVHETLLRLFGSIPIEVIRVTEGCTEITVMVPQERLQDLYDLIDEDEQLRESIHVQETFAPPENRLGRFLYLPGKPIDLTSANAATMFAPIWRRAQVLEWIIRPWRRLKWLFSPSIRSTIGRDVIYESNSRAYAAVLRDRWRSLRADLVMACIIWPGFSLVLIGLVLFLARPLLPAIDPLAGILSGLILALAGAQICSSALSPIACGSGTIAMCWAFGLANSIAIGSLRSAGVFSRSQIHKDFFISVTGGIVGLSAPNWQGRLSPHLIVLLLTGIASAIAVSGWLMAQPAQAGPPRQMPSGAIALGALAGSAMGAGIGLVRLISWALSQLGCPEAAAFIVAFALIGSLVFMLTLRLQIPHMHNRTLSGFGAAFALISTVLCGLTYFNAGGSFGLLALAASNGVYHATWFTAASVVGNRFGSARAATIATTLEGAVGFTAFVVFRMLGV